MFLEILMSFKTPMNFVIIKKNSISEKWCFFRINKENIPIFRIPIIHRIMMTSIINITRKSPPNSLWVTSFKVFLISIHYKEHHMKMMLFK